MSILDKLYELDVEMQRASSVERPLIEIKVARSILNVIMSDLIKLEKYSIFETKSMKSLSGLKWNGIYITLGE